MLEAALAEADSGLVPIDVKTLTVEIDRTLALWAVPDNWSETAPFYLEALADVPPDLVAVALRSLRRHRRWNTFPKPADLFAPIEDDLAQRRAERNRIAAALAKARREPPDSGPRVPPTEAEKRRVSRIVADITKSLSPRT